MLSPNSTPIIAFCVILGKSLCFLLQFPSKPPVSVVSIKSHSWDVTPLKALVSEPDTESLLATVQDAKLRQGPKPQGSQWVLVSLPDPLGLAGRDTSPISVACTDGLNVGSLGTSVPHGSRGPNQNGVIWATHRSLRGSTHLVLPFCFLFCVGYPGLALCQVYCFTCLPCLVLITAWWGKDCYSHPFMDKETGA